MPDELADLVAAAKGGDREAFDELVKATFTETYTLACRLCGNEEDARDVVQETYLRAYRSLKRFRGDARFTTWLYRITANCASNQLSRRARHRHEVLRDDSPVVELHPRGNPDSRIEAGDLRELLKDAIAELPPKLRAVVVLRDIYDLPHHEIARELGITESAAKVRLHRARKRLREILFPGSEEKARAV